jgi:hypothetical protein
VAGVVIAVANPEAVAERWTTVAGGPVRECSFVSDPSSPGLIEVQLELGADLRTIPLGDR